jgi:hypothetical protein
MALIKGPIAEGEAVATENFAMGEAFGGIIVAIGGFLAGVGSDIANHEMIGCAIVRVS